MTCSTRLGQVWRDGEIGERCEKAKRKLPSRRQEEPLLKLAVTSMWNLVASILLCVARLRCFRSHLSLPRPILCKEDPSERLEELLDDNHSPKRRLEEVSHCNSPELGVQRGAILICKRARVAGTLMCSLFITWSSLCWAAPDSASRIGNQGTCSAAPSSGRVEICAVRVDPCCSQNMRKDLGKIWCAASRIPSSKMNKIKANPNVSLILLEAVGVHALNDSAGDRQLQETLLLEFCKCILKQKSMRSECRHSPGRHNRRSALRAAQSGPAP